jgi:hypothetical protein
VRWLDEPEEHDYPAAEAYLSLFFGETTVRCLIGRLERADVIRRKAKDIWRASGLPLLDRDNPHVAKDIRKAEDGKALSPVLLVRGHPLLIADGYHRVCAAYWLDEDEDMPCKLVSLP